MKTITSELNTWDYGSRGNLSVKEDDSTIFSVTAGEPEDASFGRDLSDCLNVVGLLKKFYNYGLEGIEVKFEDAVIEEED